MNPYIKLIRLPQMAKNIVIFAPLFFSGALFDWNLLFITIVGCITFYGFSAVIYILNDILDVENDRKHKTKCNRPIASGRVSIRSAVIFAVCIFLASIGIGIIGFGANIYAWLILAVYFVLNLWYSAKLKKIPLVDVCIIAAGFFLRVLFGVALIDAWISRWLFIIAFALSLYLSLFKRGSEIRYEEKSAETRTSLKGYTKEYVDKSMMLCLGMALVCYALWCINDITIAKYGPNIIWTVPFTIILALRYQLTEMQGHQEPLRAIVKDKPLLVLNIAFALLMFLIIYGWL
ncbi:MAG TPA: UbiA prenyltransferase family protein [Methanocorpusculum sp.]|nr:UbiA prenyltransferase family protein [Methanocorpusculum sp.]